MNDAARLAAIVDSSDDAIISNELNGIITSWNPAAERMFGYSASEVLGESIGILVPDDRRAEEKNVLARIHRGEAVEPFDSARRHKKGDVVPVSLRVSPIRTQAGEVIGASTIARDITEKQRSSQQAAFLADASAVLASSLEYKVTLKTVTNLAVPLIADWCAIDIVREGGLEQLAIARVDPDKCELAHLVRERYENPDSPYSVPFVMRTGKPALLARIPDAMIVAAAHGDEERIRLIRALGLTSYMCVPLVAHGRTLGALTCAMAESGRIYTESDFQLAQDVAYRAALAVENARAYSQMESANRLKDEFLATLSHELRTPLNAILGYTRMMRSGLMTREKQGKAMEIVERNATSLTKIVEDVLDVSRIISGKIRLNVQPVDLPRVVNDSVDSVRPAANAKGVRVTTTVDSNAAPVSGDPERLQQVVWNLVSNAVKFTLRGGQVHVRLERVNAHVEIVVSDTGIGIPKDFLPHIFERFRQADAGTTRERGGLGLGLAIARNLVEMHGGAIHAESGGDGNGSTFRVRLPLIAHADEHLERRAHPRGPERDRAATVPDLHAVRILAVDDDDDALSLVREILEHAGAEVTTVDSAGEALDFLEAAPPDVLIADLGMPVIDGFELIGRVRRSSNPRVRKMPAAALTAYARSDDRAKALRTGFQLHLAKPVDPAELLAAISSLVRRASVE